MADAGTAKLRAAAEELAKVAVETSGATSLAAARDSVTELRHIHSGVDKLLDSVAQLQRAVEASSAEAKAQASHCYRLPSLT